MTSKKDIDNVMFATLCYHEAFLKFVQSTMPAEISTKLQMNIALTLRTVGPQSMSALSRRINVAPEQVTRAVRVMREAGIVSCEKNPENKRMVIARLTEKGGATLAAHLDTTNARISSYLDALAPNERKRLVDASRSAADVFFAHDLDDSMPPILLHPRDEDELLD